MLAVSVTAQDFYGKATYKTHRKMSIQLDSSNTNSAMQKQIQERMKKMFQKTFTLNFTATESSYKEEEQLNTPQPSVNGGGTVMVMGFGGSGSLYKNLKENRYAEKQDLMGKTFLVKDELPKYDWKLTGNKKSIGTYTCYEAVWEREVENTSMSLVDGEMKESTKKEMRKTTVWYTPKVAVGHGPENYWGLPGLILEVNDGRLTIVCTEIVLNPAEKSEIQEPKKGKVVTNDEYQKISREKTKEMMNRYRSRGGDGNSFQIRIGG